ncbi:unnamed protein product [Effrenium voratum]|uniref:ACT domain-containing protein n=1 Tax=Effrenium voratum TaxID=2562239 RepID=A0AA36NJ19_9DINO|nr:unnamed protein product [Effrenium voratum]CAJ1409117.1 unnamed protein product [Effrenium voratum]
MASGHVHKAPLCTFFVAQLRYNICQGGRSKAHACWVPRFGVDRPGQLARITETLSRFGVSVSNLRVQSGSADSTKGDFVPCPSGGPLAENRIRIRFDNSVDAADRLRKEIQLVGEEMGYAVTCLTLDSHAQFRAFMPSYLLRRRAFVVTYLMELKLRVRSLRVMSLRLSPCRVTSAGSLI